MKKVLFILITISFLLAGTMAFAAGSDEARIDGAYIGGAIEINGDVSRVDRSRELVRIDETGSRRNRIGS